MPQLEPDTAIYARQSRTSRTSYSSCDAQVRICWHLASELSYKVRDVYSDEGESSESLDRPQLTRLLAAIDAGEVRRLIVYSIDRLTRRLFHLQELLERFNRNDVELLVVTDPRFGGAAASRLMTNIVAAASEFEIEMTRERLSDARAALKRQGKRVAGRVPFGYRADSVSKTLTRHPEQSPIAEQLFELASQGIKPSELADHANSSQWRNHQNETGRWTPRWITKLLTNRVYIGEISNGVSFLPSQHPPIVSSTVFDAVQQQLANRIARGSSGWKRELIKPSNDELELLGILYCGQCDRPMSTSVSIRGHIRYRYYRCRSHAGGRPPCRGVNIAAFEADRLVKTVLSELEEPESNHSGFTMFWRGLTDQQRKETLGELIERISLSYSTKELTIQFKVELDSIITQRSPPEPIEKQGR
jgi:DNA invertase Pin-like site-specific DNA recombinase